MAGVEDNLAPVADELTVDVPLWVEGAVPPVLEGLFVRNGPNAAGDGTAYYAGDGMLHAVALREGQAVSYRNRWVRTRALAARTGRPGPGGPAAPAGDPANTNVVWHAGALLAVGGAGLPHALTAGLDTLAVEDFGGALSSPVAGHPHLDPATGALVWITATTGEPPLVRAVELGPGGGLAASVEVALAWPTAQRDFGLTATRLVVVDLPAAVGPTASVDLTGAAAGRVGVVERGAEQAGAAVRWSEVGPAAVSHVANAYDDGDSVVLDVCRSGSAVPGSAVPGSGSPCAPAFLERWRVGADGVTTTRLDDRPVGLPRVDGALSGRRHRYLYCVQGGIFGSLVRYDMQRDEAVVWDPGPGRAAGEPVFVRDPDGHADDEGWILSFVYDAGRGASELVVIDGSSWGGRPDAVVHLPARVPYGLHGTWVAAALYR